VCGVDESTWVPIHSDSMLGNSHGVPGTSSTRAFLHPTELLYTTESYFHEILSKRLNHCGYDIMHIL
jgi:hypothetical protein